jgi:predicted ribosomally synthesized peptide with nif11-like leader
MSQQAVIDFLAKVAEDEGLQQKFSDIIDQDKPKEEMAVDAANIGAEYGYEFTSSEILQEIQNRIDEYKTRESSGELTDEELEAVAGGGTPLVIFSAFSAAVTAEVGSRLARRFTRRW